MTDDPHNFLNQLTIWKLKTVAEEFGVDVSNCKFKRDYVQKIATKKITEEQVRTVLSKPKKKGREPEQEVKDIGKEIEAIAKSPTEPLELPRKEEKEIEKHLDEALMLKPALFDVDSKAQAAYSKMILGEYYDALKLNREARLKGLEDFSSFQVYSAAVSIRAADELFAKLVSDKGQLDPILRTALAEAKRAFINGPPKRREETLEGLEVLSTKAYDAFISNSEKEEAELMGLLADYESFGTRTDESRRYLEIASQAKRSLNIAEHSKLLRDARDRAEHAKGLRTREIKNTFPIVRAATIAAKDAGVDTSSAESRMEDARKAYDDGAFSRAVEMLASIERQVDSAHLEQIRGKRELEARQLESARTTLTTHEPILLEASQYGLEAGEGLVHINTAKTALNRKDAVNAAKHSVRVKDIVLSMENDIDAKRIDRGVIKRVEGAKCDKCGQEALYAYPDRTEKCVKCGQKSATVPPAAQPAPGKQPSEPKKKWALRW